MKIFPDFCGWDKVLHMWTGGRSLKSLALAGGFVASLNSAMGQTPLCEGQHPGNPVLVSGAASCVYNEIGGIGSTQIDLSANSIIRWNHLGLEKPGSQLQFFSSGNVPNPTVLNHVTGRSPGALSHSIQGDLSFDQGRLILSNPAAPLTIGGRIQAASVIVSTHDLDPQMQENLLRGEAADFLNSQHGLTLENGRITATQGDVVLAGREITLSNPSLDESNGIQANTGSVRIFGGSNFRLLNNGPQRLESLPGNDEGSGNVLNGGNASIRAGRNVEIRANASITNRTDAVIESNPIDGGLFFRVDDGKGTVTNDGFMRAFVFSDPDVTGEGTNLNPTGDEPQLAATGISRFPVVSRPGQKVSVKNVVVYESAPTAGTASTQRDRAQRGSGNKPARETRLVSNTRTSSGLLARGRSFFGLRGGAKAKKKKE